MIVINNCKTLSSLASSYMLPALNITRLVLLFVALASVSACVDLPPDQSKLDKQYFDAHREQWEAAIDAWLANPKSKELDKFENSDGRFLGLKKFRDCFVFEFDTETYDSRRAVIYRLNSARQNEATEHTFFDTYALGFSEQLNEKWTYTQYD